MKALEYIKNYKKGFVFEQYTRIIANFKEYEKITKVKMLEALYKKYGNPEGIISICTERELKYLELVCVKNKEYLNDKYNWERTTLRKKFIIYDDFDSVEIYEELQDAVNIALKNIDWKQVKENDRINEFLVSFCKIQGTSLVFPLINLGSGFLNIDRNKIIKHIETNLVFDYYVDIIGRTYEELDGEIQLAVYDDFYEIIDELDEERAKQGKAQMTPLTIEDYKSLFYNDFNMNNPTIKKFYDELMKLPFFTFSAIKPIQECALLNIDRKSLKEAISAIPALEDIDLTDFFKLMDEAMDEMPSGALNGLTPNDLKKLEEEELKYKLQKEANYTPQVNACLNHKDAKLFYKLYFALLEFTNKKYQIIPGYKIYNMKGINPAEINDIIEKFWQVKDEIILAFTLANPYNFTAEEIELVNNFKQGFRGNFVLAKFEKNYTAIMNDEKVFMIKGINDNIDNVVSYDSLPTMITTAILPFKNYIIYDGIISSYQISFGPGFNKIVEEEYKHFMKYYHL